MRNTITDLMGRNTKRCVGTAEETRTYEHITMLFIVAIRTIGNTITYFACRNTVGVRTFIAMITHVILTVVSQVGTIYTVYEMSIYGVVVTQ
jgi:hypothetical protein